MNLLLAPLQGFTDVSFRNAFEECFGNIDTYYSPYITLQNDGSIKKSQWRDLLPERNNMPVIPQILAANAKEALDLTQRIVDLETYKEVNLNLGCPYPMVTNKGRGSALLQKPEELALMLEALFSTYGDSLNFSVKMRCGLVDFEEVHSVIEVLNRFPIAYTILHARVAKQLYKGKADQDCFGKALAEINHPLYYNGDIYTLDNYNQLVDRFPTIEGVMVGRGVLENPFLPREIKTGEIYDKTQKMKLFSEFHQALFEANEAHLSGESHLLSKMKSYLPYFTYLNPENKKAYKKVKKCKGLRGYTEGMNDLMRG